MMLFRPKTAGGDGSNLVAIAAAMSNGDKEVVKMLAIDLVW